MFWLSSGDSIQGYIEGDLVRLLTTSFSESLKSSKSSPNTPRYKKTAMKNFVKKIITTKSQVNTILLALCIYMLFASVAIIHHLNERINKEQYLRICPEPYVCVIPPKEWKGITPMGLTVYKKIPV